MHVKRKNSQQFPAFTTSQPQLCHETGRFFRDECESWCPRTDTLHGVHDFPPNSMPYLHILENSGNPRRRRGNDLRVEVSYRFALHLRWCKQPQSLAPLLPAVRCLQIAYTTTRVAGWILNVLPNHKTDLILPTVQPVGNLPNCFHGLYACIEVHGLCFPFLTLIGYIFSFLHDFA